jgi:sarcosine oxidase subunit delta
LRRPEPDASEAAWVDYVYLRDNPCGPHDELWYHGAGCRSWFKVRRDTRTHDILASAPIERPLGGDSA